MNNQMNMRMKKNSLRGQNVIEYLILTVAVVIVLFYTMNTKAGPMKNALDNILNDTVQDIKNLNSELKFNTSP